MEIKNILECIYYVTGSLLFIIAIYQMHTAKRAHKCTLASKAVEIDQFFKDKIIPKSDELLMQLMKAKGGLHQRMEKKPSDEKIASYDTFLNSNYAIVESLLDMLETYAIIINEGSVNKKMLYSSNARSYCNLIEHVAIFIFLINRSKKSINYEEVMFLYKKWEKKLSKKNLLKEIIIYLMPVQYPWEHSRKLGNV